MIAPTHAAAPFSERFLDALTQVQEKLLLLLAKAPLLLIAILIVLVAIWFGGVLSRRMRVLRRISQRNPYLEGLIRTTVKVVIGLAGVLVALDLLGASSLVGAVLGSAGVIGLVLGFAFKDIAENYVAGVLLSLRQPFAPGDSVRIDTYEGSVISLNSRTTILMTSEGNHLQLPNSFVFKSILLNFSHNPKRRFEFTLMVGHEVSLHTALDIGIAAIIDTEGVIADPAPNGLVASLDNDGASLRFTGWIDQTRNDLSRTRSEAMRRVRRALRKTGIVPPEARSRVMLVRTETLAELPGDYGRSRDTSVDHALDDQIDRARLKEDGGNLLEATPPDPKG